MAAATAADPSARAEAGERVRPADISIVGPVDGTNEKHPDGSYFRLVAMRGDEERHQFLFSRGAAECLRDELIGALEKIGRGDPAASASRSPAAGGVAAEGFRVGISTMRESDKGESHTVTIYHPNRPKDATIFDSEGRMEVYSTYDRENADHCANEWREFFATGHEIAAFASPAETKATLADATFDLAAPTHRVEAGAVRQFLTALDAFNQTTEGLGEPFDLMCAKRATLDAALATAGDGWQDIGVLPEIGQKADLWCYNTTSLKHGSIAERGWRITDCEFATRWSKNGNWVTGRLVMGRWEPDRVDEGSIIALAWRPVPKPPLPAPPAAQPESAE